MHVGTCIYCRTSTGRFTSEEHILPETLGNTHKTLPPGVVCDTCNHGVLSRLDRAFLELTPVHLARTIYGTPNKAGKKPQAYFDGLTMTWDDTGKLHGRVSPEAEFNYHNVGGEIVKFTSSFKGNQRWDKNYLKFIARALFKFTLGFLHLDHGSAMSMHPRFDEVRDIILSKCSFHGFLICNTTIKPHGDVVLSYNPNYTRGGAPLTAVSLDVHGFEIGTELEQRQPPLQQIPAELMLLTF